MIKTLQRVGNSSALVIEKAVMELMGINQESPLRLTVEGKKLIVEALTESERKKLVRKAILDTAKENEELFRRLAK